MLGRRKKTEEPVVVAERPGAKNRPTPRRRDREAANRRPLVPTDRKSAAKASREQMRADRLKTRAAMMSGDEAHLPPRDKGPVKRYVRDYVDARWNAGEFFLVVALVVVLLTFSRNLQVQFIAQYVLWATVLACLLDGYLLSRQLRKQITQRFGPEVLTARPKPVTYGVLRAFQIRRTRLPKPQVARGQYPA